MEPANAKIRRGRPADYATVMDRVLTSFSEMNPTHPPFPYVAPNVCRPTAAAMRQWLLAELDGEVAAGMQIVPRSVIVAGNVQIPVGGLANVFCYPLHRKHGLMSALLERTGQELEKDGFALSMLGGDRLRYGRYGWEHAGAERVLQISGAVRRSDTEAPVSAVRLRRWQGNKKDTRRMLEAFLALPYHTTRTMEDMELTLRRSGGGLAVWLCDEPETGFAYVVLNGNSVVEYAGAATALEVILRFLIKSRAWDARIPPTDAETERERVLLGFAQSYSVVPAAMVRIVSLERVLACYEPVLARRLRGWRGAVTLAVSGTGEEVTVSGTAGGLSIGRKRTKADRIALDTREMVRLLFGPFPPCLETSQDHEFVRRAFPLPLYWHGLSHV